MKTIYWVIILFFLVSCKKQEDTPPMPSEKYPAIAEMFKGRIDLDNLENYCQQGVPFFIQKDNTTNNTISDAGATLGRVLFYDRNLSSNKQQHCGGCHSQYDAFSDQSGESHGAFGFTKRHSMRLVNNRFSRSPEYFWDKRATTLEEQTTMPIQDEIEMGFSGHNGQPNFEDLIERLEGIDYYQELFTFVYGDAEITEEKIQNALAQFVRSIQSFDSKYDQGIAQTGNHQQPFPNYTLSENNGKNLFTRPPNQGGAGCAGCHQPPEFDIDPLAGNNGIVDILNKPGETDYTIKRAPSLRNLTKPNGILNGPLMHSARFNSLSEVINYYNALPPSSDNPELDQRLKPNGNLQQLNLTAQQKSDLEAFLLTLSGVNVYSDEKWSDPFFE